MKAFLVLDDSLHYLPETWNASDEPTLTVASGNLVSAENATVTRIANTKYVIDVSKTEGDFVIVVADERYQITVYRDTEDFTKLEYWLEQHQLDYLIPVCKRLGWGKLKEAALKCRSISLMQGSEYALDTVLKLLDIRDNVNLERIWISNGADVTYGRNGELIVSNGTKAYDNLHATGYARKNFHLSNFLKLQYVQDDLITWEQSNQSRGIIIHYDLTIPSVL
jgi:hypothetical protein